MVGDEEELGLSGRGLSLVGQGIRLSGKPFGQAVPASDKLKAFLKKKLMAAAILFLLFRMTEMA